MVWSVTAASPRRGAHSVSQPFWYKSEHGSIRVLAGSQLALLEQAMAWLEIRVLAGSQLGVHAVRGERAAHAR